MWPQFRTDGSLIYGNQLIFAEHISDFDYSPMLKMIQDLDDNCKDKEHYNVLRQDNEFKQCVERTMYPSENFKLNYDCELGNEFKLFSFAEQYNRCAGSQDDDCMCILFGNYEGIAINEEAGEIIASLGEHKALLNTEFQGQIVRVLHKTGAKLEPAAQEYPECRVNRRTVKICYDHKRGMIIDGKTEKLLTKYATVVLDEAAPPEIEFSVNKAVVTWKPSPAPDVKRYRIYAVPKGAPFVEDEFIPIERAVYPGSFKNFDQIFSFTSPKDLTNFDVKVIAEDFSGNFNLP
jgi:hypothetical protein